MNLILIHEVLPRKAFMEGVLRVIYRGSPCNHRDRIACRMYRNSNEEMAFDNKNEINYLHLLT